MRYVLKAVRENMTSLFNPEFKYEFGKRAKVNRFKPTRRCDGHKLYGFLDGKGDTSLIPSGDKLWIVLSVRGKIVDMDGKVGFGSGVVEFAGTVQECAKFLKSKGVDPDFGSKTYGRTVQMKAGRSYCQRYPDEQILGADRCKVYGGNGTVKVGNFCPVAFTSAKVVCGDFCAISLIGGTVTCGSHCTINGKAVCAGTHHV